MIPISPLEQALIDLKAAVDGSGLPVHLFWGPITPVALAEATRSFILASSSGSVFFGANFQPSLLAEAAYWRNLALLARATAELIQAAASEGPAI